MQRRPKKSLARCFGEFFGHIRHGVKTNVSGNSKQITRHDRQEASQIGPNGEQVTMRRTTIEEIEVKR